MALPKSVIDREKQKFVEDSSGDVAVRTKETADAPTIPAGASTEAKQDDIITELQKKSDEATTPTEYNVTLTSADTQYSQALPANTKEFRFRCRTIFDVRYSFTTGKVATPTTPYFTLPAGSDYFSDKNDLSSKTLYLASSEAGVIVELETWA